MGRMVLCGTDFNAVGLSYNIYYNYVPTVSKLKASIHCCAVCSKLSSFRKEKAKSSQL